MNRQNTTSPDLLRRAIGNTLSIGVYLAITVILVGIFVVLAEQPGLWQQSASQYVLSLKPAPISPSLLLEAFHHSPGLALATLGVVLIICTPLARCSVATAILIRTREFRFVPLTCFVLFIITGSVLLGLHLRP
ncbi:MAG: DUF1634 domain-containing protein [Candidatus Dormibacteria bacterium]